MVLAEKRRRKNFLYKYLLYCRHGINVDHLVLRYEGCGLVLPMSMQAAQEEFNKLSNEIRRLLREAAKLRSEMLQQKLDEAEAAGDKSEAKKCRHIIAVEEQRQLTAVVKANK